MIKMDIKHLSIKNLTISILLVIGFFSILVLFVSGEHFFKAARESQLYSLQRVIHVATKEIMQELHDQAYDVATVLSVKGEIPKIFPTAIKSSNKDELIKLLDDPFITGFVGAYIIELVKVRVYDLDFKFVAESNKGSQGLPHQIPEMLYQKGYSRKDSERMKAITALWSHADHSHYSVLVPIGGIFISGYLEIVVDPVNNLIKLSEKMDSPVSVRSGINPNKIYHVSNKPIEQLLPIEYILKTESGAPAYILTSYEDIAKLSEGVNEAVSNAIIMFVGMLLIVLFGAIWLFQLFLFKPVNMMLKQIRQITDGNIAHDLQIKGLAEIAFLSEEFNKMTKEIRSREEELTRLSIIDGLTKISNRRKFDEVLNNEYLIGCRTNKQLSLLMIDIDYFKLFNDTYGHLAGDDCIKKIAMALKNSVYRPGDLVARYGGEEFAIILSDTSENGERVIAKKIMNEIAKLGIPHSSSKVCDTVTVSIGGYTLTPTNDSDPLFIVAEADRCLYHAKESGRNKFILSSDS